MLWARGASLRFRFVEKHRVYFHLNALLFPASKHGIDVGAGVIDADYRGLLGVLLFNLGDANFTIQKGDRIAQLVLERIATPEVQVVEVSIFWESFSSLIPSCDSHWMIPYAEKEDSDLQEALAQKMKLPRRREIVV